ncbi:MAG: hypothetical protein E7442_04055 [Ruminococcaceae bacterium]|nr:hypothetical protein [Oscillospiraceae bacterium]
MTLGEGKKKVYVLLDEYGSGDGVDEDLEAKMNSLFDIAQKDVAKICRIVRTVKLRGEGRYPMPADFIAVQRIWRNGENVTRKCVWRCGELVLGAGERVELDYFAAPATIDDNTPESWEFELREDACEAMPFYVAGMVLSSDLVQDGQIYLDLYEKAKRELSSVLPGSEHRVVNSLFG